MFKSAEEKEAERREREAQAAREAAAAEERARAAKEAKARAAWLASPVGSATAAKEAGERFLELQLPVGGHIGEASWGTSTGTRTVASSASVLGQIEEVGWRLEHASYFFMVTGESSTDRFFNTGQEIAVSGQTIGVYLFRNASG